jgi:hypothetical protein
MKTNAHLWSYLAQLFLEWEVFQKNLSLKSKHSLCSTFLENRAIYEIIWKNIVEPDRPQVIIWRMRIACWITKAIDPYSEYVLSISFP